MAKSNDKSDRAVPLGSGNLTAMPGGDLKRSPRRTPDFSLSLFPKLRFMRKSATLSLLIIIGLVSYLNAEQTPVEGRVSREKRWIDNGIPMMPHHPNYILPFTYNTNRNDETYVAAGEPRLKNPEVKFQISFKVPLWDEIGNRPIGLYFAYTQLGMWQFYNRRASAPLRDTNYEPEIFFQIDTNEPLGPVINRMIVLGGTHQSNGRRDPLSRSWNRVYVQGVFEYRQFVFSVKPWVRLFEPSPDDNPNITQYVGHAELHAAYKWQENVFSAMLRNNFNFKRNNRGSVELTWSFPLSGLLKGYLQYFNGYGESLIDYNHYNNRLGFGIALTDWL